MQNSKHGLRSALFLGAATFAALTLASAASAQNVETVTVTGTLIQGNTSVVSPVTVIDTANLDKSGISSIEGALQSSILNNGPAVNNNWTANGNFASGASAISLRALTTNSTLVLFDGMRAAYYPLADDGTRAFVDLNTIPDDIVERIDVLRDGASSSYGADAIAGVVNIITKKEFQGLAGRAEGGIADRGDAGSFKFSLTAGMGDLAKDHVNAYVSASYYHSDPLYAKSRPYPFNTLDWSNVCYDGCYGDSTINATNNASFALSTAANFITRPYTVNAKGQIVPSGTAGSTVIAGSHFQNLDGCAEGTSLPTPAGSAATYPSTICRYDYQNLYGTITPAVTRVGLTGHSAFVLPSGIDGYVEANFMQDNVSYYNNTAAAMRGNAPAGIYYSRYSTSTNYDGTASFAPGSHVLYLPAYVCAARVNCDASNGTLNPNDPYASIVDPVTGQHEVAALTGRDWFNTRPYNETRDRTYRIAGELNGSLFSDWKWNVGVTAMHIDLNRLSRGYVYIQHLLDVVADGSYNFVNPAANSKATLDYLMPDNSTNSSSDVAQAKLSVTAPLYQLPGGDLTLVAGASVHYEGVNAPSANSDINGPTQRYFTLNAFGTVGNRDVYAGFFEINAPVLEELTLNVSGRYDSYSSGQSNFSPKFGFNAKPFESLTIKGSYSEGFRIPSFGEANSTPTTGYVSNTKTLFTDSYLAQYGCTVASFSSCPAYIRSGTYGQTTLATPNLKPEKSRSWVLDTAYQPFDELTLTVTYYNIKKTDAITTNFSPAVLAYYSGAAIPAGYSVVPDSIDPDHPLAKPRLSSASAHFINANSIRTAGWDFGVVWDRDLDSVENFLGVNDTLGAIHVTSAAQATFIQNLDTKFPDGTIERYDGTLGNNALTAGTGTPKWKGKWQTTFSTDKVDFTSSLNWISGYNVSAMDSGTGYRDCGLDDGSVPCRINDFFTWDINTQYKASDNIKLYFSVNNVLDNMPPVDTIATYSLTGYNVVTGSDGILGRYLKVGIKLDY